MKKFLTIAILCLMAITAKADYTLYWMASPWSADYWGAQYAALKGYDQSSESYVQLAKTRLDKGTNTQIGSESSYVDFIVSLYKYDTVDGWVELAVSWDRYTYRELIDGGYAYDTSLGDATQMAKDPLVFRSFVIPEPTSGLMLLLGLGALALRRKRV